MAAAPFLSVALMAFSPVSEDPRPVGLLPRPRSSDDWSIGDRSFFNGIVWRTLQASSLYADTFNSQACAGWKKILAITLAVQSGDPLKNFVSLRKKTEGAGEFVGRAFPRIRIGLRFQIFSVPTTSALVAAATIKVHRERNWKVGVLWRLEIHYQPRKPLHSGTTKDEGQVFDKMPVKTEEFSVYSSVQRLIFSASPAPSYGNEGFYPFRNQSQSREQKSEDSAPFQIMIVLLSGKTWLQWVKPSDLVQSLKLKLEAKEGIPTALQRLILEGKHLEDSSPLSCYNLQRNASISLSLRLRGGAAGQSSSAPAFSYKDAVHAQKSKNKTPPAQVPKPFSVDKLEEVSSIEINDPSLDLNHQVFAETGIICRFNGLWPRTADLYQWIHSNWTKNCKVHLCSKGFFIVLFSKNEDYQRVLSDGPWFWNSAGLFLTPWFQDFDPSSAVITKLPIWVRLHNLPAHLWHQAVFEGIGNSLGRLLNADYSRAEQGIYTFARICAEIDISRGLPDQINLKIGDFHWTQSLDFENTAFRCRICHLTGHLQNSCPSILSHNTKANSKPKPKRWMLHDPPPLDVSSSSDEEDGKSDEEILADSPSQETPAPVSTAVCLKENSVNPFSQKRSHEASPPEFDKEISPSAQRSLQIYHKLQNSGGIWIRAGKKKGKKGRPNDSTQAV